MADETLARMFWGRVASDADRPAQMIKEEGRWQTLAWSQVGETVRELALGLLALGRRPGDAVALLSRSRAEWVQADLAILSTGCLTVPIYPTYTPRQVAYIVNDSEARTLIVEDAAQLAKALEVRDQMRGLAEIVVIASGEAHALPVLTWTELRRRGRAQASALNATLADRVSSIATEDIATIVYTSGTTGEPKGVVQTHANHMASLSALARLLPALQWLKRRSGGSAAKASLLGRALLTGRALPEDEGALGRMGLALPRGMGERLLRRLVALGLAATR
jgi:long-chain acyl-CoA synthetase